MLEKPGSAHSCEISCKTTGSQFAHFPSRDEMLGEYSSFSQAIAIISNNLRVRILEFIV